MSTAGMTPQGYVASTVDDEVADLNSKILTNVNGTLDLSPDQPFGQIIGVFAEKFTELTELGATVYNAMNPDGADAQLLTNVCAITGTSPQVATYSQVTLNMVLNAGASVSPGATAIVNGQPTNIWVLTGPPGQPGANVVNTGGVQATFQGNFRAQTAGPVTANAGTITVIGTPTTGWISVTNPTAATAGLAADTDTTLRQRRAIELLGQGSGDLDAIRSAVLKVGGVVQCFVYENTSMTTDLTSGRPAKSFQVVIWDGATMAASNDAVAQAIWDNKPAGISPYGATTGNATDSLGTLQVMSFDRATQVPVYISINTSGVTPSAAQVAAIKAAVASFAQANWNLDVPVLYDSLFGLVFGVIGYSGATKVASIFLGTTPSPAGTSDLVMGQLQIAILNTTLVNGA